MGSSVGSECIGEIEEPRVLRAILPQAMPPIFAWRYGVRVQRFQLAQGDWLRVERSNRSRLRGVELSIAQSGSNKRLTSSTFPYMVVFPNKRLMRVTYLDFASLSPNSGESCALDVASTLATSVL
jgi:hypothetical protein